MLKHGYYTSWFDYFFYHHVLIKPKGLHFINSRGFIKSKTVIRSSGGVGCVVRMKQFTRSISWNKMIDPQLISKNAMNLCLYSITILECLKATNSKPHSDGQLYRNRYSIYQAHYICKSTIGPCVRNATWHRLHSCHVNAVLPWWRHGMDAHPHYQSFARRIPRFPMDSQRKGSVIQ